MLRLSLATLLSMLALPAFAGSGGFPEVDPADNVNSRYTVERVDVMGDQSRNVSRSVRHRLDSMIGHKLDSTALDRIAARIREELRADRVHVHIGKGTHPQHVAVQLEIESRRKTIDFSLSRLGFVSGEGVTGSLGMSVDFAGNRAGVAYIVDADQWIERAAGVQGSFERNRLTPESKFGMRAAYGAFSEQWGAETLNAFAANPAAIRYGRRTYVEPEVTMEVTPELQVSAGVSVEHLGEVASSTNHDLAANGVTASVRYRSRFENSATYTQNLEALYGMRLAARPMGSDFSYSKHTGSAGYTIRHFGQTLKLKWLAGLVNGTAPMYDRLALGNSQTLRGWNKYALAPLGGSRIVHGSVEYRFKMLEAFYDTGAIWDRGSAQPSRGVKHSVGCGIRKDSLQLAVAFPMKNGRLDPVFLAGVNF